MPSIRVWLQTQYATATDSLVRLWRAPTASLLTLLVIGIALALPTGLQVTLSGVSQLRGALTGNASISLFLHQEISLPKVELLLNNLSQWPEIAQVQWISPEEALEEFRQLSGFREALEVLEENPLPHVCVLHPRRSQNHPEAMQQLMERLNALPEVEIAQLDLRWVQRLHALTKIAQRVLFVIATLLGLAVLLVIGNTIRLEVQNRRDEIAISQLLGATDAFIRRPFLYTGLWYGLGGALIAWLLVNLSLLLLAKPVSHLASLYHSGAQFTLLDLQTSGLLLLSGLLLGWCGAWLAVSQQLSQLDPMT